MADDVLLSDAEFQSLIDRVKNREPGAPDAFVRACAPYVRNYTRARFRKRNLSPARLGASVSDICQSVFRCFLRKLRADKVKFASPDQARKHLSRWVKDRIAAKARRKQPPLRPPGAATTSDRDDVEALIAEARRLFSDEEYELLRLKYLEGLGWAEVAARMGRTAEARCKQGERALKRVRARLGEKDRPGS